MISFFYEFYQKDSVEAAIHDSCTTMGMLHGICFFVASIDKKVRQMTRFHRYFPYSDGQLAIGMVSTIASSVVQSEMKLSLPTVAQLQKGVDGDIILQRLIGSLAAKSSDPKPFRGSLGDAEDFFIVPIRKPKVQNKRTMASSDMQV